MVKKRTYSDACGVARALDRVGERWALMIVRELLLGPKRFTDVRTGLPSLSADVLAQRLRELEEIGVVRRRRLPPPAAAQVYELTEWGLELEPVLVALGRWGARAAPPPEGVGMSLDSHVVSLRTLFDPERAHGFAARIALNLGEDRFRVEVADGRVEACRGELAEPDATIIGDQPVVARFLGLFPLPEPADAGA